VPSTWECGVTVDVRRASVSDIHSKLDRDAPDVSIAELSAVLERVRKIKGIETTETSIHLQTFR
jgi:hypothetical protein